MRVSAVHLLSCWIFFFLIWLARRCWWIFYSSSSNNSSGCISNHRFILMCFMFSIHHQFYSKTHLQGLEWWKNIQQLNKCTALIPVYVYNVKHSMHPNHIQYVQLCFIPCDIKPGELFLKTAERHYKKVCLREFTLCWRIMVVKPHIVPIVSFSLQNILKGGLKGGSVL